VASYRSLIISRLLWQVHESCMLGHLKILMRILTTSENLHSRQTNLNWASKVSYLFICWTWVFGNIDWLANYEIQGLLEWYWPSANNIRKVIHSTPNSFWSQKCLCQCLPQERNPLEKMIQNAKFFCHGSLPAASWSIHSRYSWSWIVQF
jgi:hypothetical protein